MLRYAMKKAFDFVFLVFTIKLHLKFGAVNYILFNVK